MQKEQVAHLAHSASASQQQQHDQEHKLLHKERTAAKQVHPSHMSSPPAIRPCIITCIVQHIMYPTCKRSCYKPPSCALPSPPTPPLPSPLTIPLSPSPSHHSPSPLNPLLSAAANMYCIPGSLHCLSLLLCLVICIVMVGISIGWNKIWILPVSVPLCYDIKLEGSQQKWVMYSSLSTLGSASWPQLVVDSHQFAFSRLLLSAWPPPLPPYPLPPALPPAAEQPFKP